MPTSYPILRPRKSGALRRPHAAAASLASVGFDTIYYPVYLIRFASERGERSIVLDGCTGKELLFPVS